MLGIGSLAQISSPPGNLLRSSGYQPCGNLLQALAAEEDSVALQSRYIGQVCLWGIDNATADESGPESGSLCGKR
ncbi:hypothetical protein GRJ2_000300400 [Grus japonensis]|uniref:Uncharacterized protein n=1 Tax=Grus japonensis TaxID=30415 RepID=A0ABC9VZ51_GRUJA